MRPYADYAGKYLDAGFFPIPANGKRVIKNQHHGRDKPLVTAEEVAKWSRLHPDSNIALRLPRDVIGIDVDAYAGKPGEETLRQLERDLGALPGTLMSTSRDDWVSGIRLFRLPDRYWSVIWPGKAGPGIDIIWHGNRYMVAWPSVHPDTGLTYHWYDQNDDGTLDAVSVVPALSEDWLPNFPKDWCDYFARKDTGNELADVASTADWIKRLGGGEPCDMMHKILGRMSDSIVGDAHGSTSEALFAITREMLRGHSGGSVSIGMAKQAFFEEIGARTHARKLGASPEWRRMLDSAVRKAEAYVPEQERSTTDPCLEDLDLGSVTPTRISKAVLWAGDVSRQKVDWLQRPVIPFGALSILDGDPGQGKSTICDGMVARAVQGLPLLPYGDHCGRPIRAGIIGAEDDLGWIVGRLEAGGYEASLHGKMVAFYRLARKRGKIEQITFPDGVEKVRAWIMTAGLEFVIVDPVTSFLGENVKSHVDASVRAALGPLAMVAQDTGAAILMVRHLNKSGDMKAMYRGGGSIAFSAIARSGLITGQLPDSDAGRFAIAQVKCSAAPKMPVSLAYSVTGWEEDADIPVIAWHGEVALSADELVAGPKSKHGPAAEAQDDIRAILKELFDQKPTWPAKTIKTVLADNGHNVKSSSVRKVKDEMGIVSRRRFQRGQISTDVPWDWTTEPAKFRGSSSQGTD